MADLYRGIAGSPITYLASDISAAQTTISIGDDRALPDAPNICTIGFGENLETIKYGVKSNGVLQEVVRGIEGTSRAWQAGTEVARFFTAYDHNAIIENFKTHLADYASFLATNEIEKGSNTNGSYIRYANGVQICFATQIVSFNTTDNQRFPYPANFTQVLGGGHGISSPSSGDGWTIVSDILNNHFSGLGLSSDGWEIWFRDSPVTSNTTRKFNFFAIGYWK
ncbi:hypothetical protein GOQ29_04960 [Clostridium sp. D2Q-14]|uniref:hypothetical protein n=1 Tax=Anaeromonas gelatinilytica TaxID=2683194 RepID=UPI00193BC71F|nr:hypothetical protein [Anaeromonas gelatinilytica]MBS4534966.1 hypothetical protein [Anaeromonas gelatinilytica]